MKMRFLLALAGLASGSTLARVFVVIALLACNSNAASLQPSETRQKWEDLEVITLDSQGNPAKTVYYSHDQLLTLPTVTVKTERDPNTNTPATYTGVYIGDLFEAFGADASFDVVVAQLVVTTAPDPEGTLDEFARVLKPGGEIVLLSRVGAEDGMRRKLEHLFAPAARKLGWRSEFAWERYEVWVARTPGIRIAERRAVPPLGHFSVIRFRKDGPSRNRGMNAVEIEYRRTA